MTKKMIIIACMLCLGTFLPLAHAEEFVIKDYIFTWYVANAGDAKIEIQKSPEGLAVILKSLGGPLTTLSIPPCSKRLGSTGRRLWNRAGPWTSLLQPARRSPRKSV